MTRFPLVPIALAALVAQPLSLSAQINAALKGLEGRKVLEHDDRAGAFTVQGTVFEVRGDSGGVATHQGAASG